MTGFEFEDFSAQLLIKNGYLVRVAQRTDDEGRDLITRSPDNQLYVIECKQKANYN
ncbi:MAG: restriction endonuclease [Candidatus Hodarchaeales archaeon]|jgi:HJR/Mrr/RecB family endonuclease